MRRLNFFEYDMKSDEERPLYSLTLDEGKITSPDPEGQDYLVYLLKAYDLGICHRDVKLFGEGKYEELFDFFEHKARNPNLYVRRG